MGKEDEAAMNRWRAVAALKGLPTASSAQAAVHHDALNLLQKRSQQVVVRTSNIVGAGHGVFATDTIDRGTLLCSYAGIYTPPVPIVGGELFGSTPVELFHLEGDYIYCCETGGWIDGQHHTVQQGFDVAQLSNHAPANLPPNALMITVEDFPADCGVVALAAGEPWYWCPADGAVNVPANVPLKGSVLISVQDIEPGEEIFHDYDLVREKCPDWYSPVTTKYANGLLP